MTISPPAEKANIVPPLATRRLTAERELLTALLSPVYVSHPDHRDTAMADRALLWERIAARMAGYVWAEPAHGDILAAGSRIVAQQQFPGPSAVESELRRAGAMDAAARISDLARTTPCDAQADYWMTQCVELARACAMRSDADRLVQALDCGQSVADVEPLRQAVVAAGVEAAAKPKSILSLCHNVAGLLANPAPLAEPIIDGGLRRGEIGLWIGATKTAKSWSMMHWHVAMATGDQCFDYPCHRGRSLMVDCELAYSTNAHRLKRVAAIYNNPDLSSIELVSFRENPITIDALIPMLELAGPGRFDFISIDPIFKLLPANADENNNAFIASFFARLIALATKLQCAILCVHHTSKGLQSSKSVSDLGAGAGAQSRSVDWHCGLREHAEPGCVSLHTLCRSFAPTEPSVWKLEPPEITHMAGLDPEDLKQAKPRKKTVAAEPKPERPPRPNWMAVAGLLKTDEPRDVSWFAAELNLPEKTARSLVNQATAKNVIFKWQSKSYREPTLWAKIPKPLTA